MSKGSDERNRRRFEEKRSIQAAAQVPKEERVFLLDSKGRPVDDNTGAVLSPEQVVLLQVDKGIAQLTMRAMQLIEAGADPSRLTFHTVAVEGAARAIEKVSDVLLEAALEVNSKPVTKFEDAKRRVLEGVKRMRVALEEIAAIECEECSSIAAAGLDGGEPHDDQLPLPTPLG